MISGGYISGCYEIKIFIKSSRLFGGKCLLIRKNLLIGWKNILWIFVFTSMLCGGLNQVM